MSVHVGFVVDKLALGQVSLQVLPFSPVNIIPPLLYTHESLPREVCDSPNQAACYHTLGPKSGASSLTPQLAGNKERKMAHSNLPLHEPCNTDVLFQCNMSWS
jgi:hypothetical protein